MAKQVKALNELTDGELLEQLKDFVKTELFQKAKAASDELYRRGVIISIKVPAVNQDGK